MLGLHYFIEALLINSRSDNQVGHINSTQRVTYYIIFHMIQVLWLSLYFSQKTHKPSKGVREAISKIHLVSINVAEIVSET